jgi:hypothetical protein
MQVAGGRGGEARDDGHGLVSEYGRMAGFSTSPGAGQ